VQPESKMIETKQLTEEQLADRNLQREIAKHSDKQTARRIKRLSRSSYNIDSVWAIVLGLVFENTKPQGRMEPFLR
jgi:hypothetical protein